MKNKKNELDANTEKYDRIRVELFHGDEVEGEELEKLSDRVDRLQQSENDEKNNQGTKN